MNPIKAIVRLQERKKGSVFCRGKVLGGWICLVDERKEYKLEIFYMPGPMLASSPGYLLWAHHLPVIFILQVEKPAFRCWVTCPSHSYSLVETDLDPSVWDQDPCPLTTPGVSECFLGLINHSVSPLQHKSSHRQGASTQAWLCSRKLYDRVGGTAHGPWTAVCRRLLYSLASRLAAGNRWEVFRTPDARDSSHMD